MNRAYSVLDIKAVDEQKRKFSGIASTPSTDRMGDIVEPKGAQFKLPIPLLWQHDSRDPIGWVTSAKVTNSGIEVEGEIANIPEEGELKNRLLKAWQMIKNKLVRGLSIGFDSIESARIEGTYGYRFIKWEWLELSAVTIPANQDATITAIKSIDRALLAASGRSAVDKPSGVPGKTKSQGANMKTLQELKEARQTKSGRMEELIETKTAESRQFTEAEAAEFDILMAEVKQLDDDIRLKSYEAMAASTAKAVSQDASHSAASFSRGPDVFVRSSDKDEKFKGQNFTRMVIAKALANLEGISAAGIAEARWGKSNPLLVRILKANEVAGGNTGASAWGHELVQANNQYTGDFIEFLKSKTVYDKLPLREIPANVLIKGQDGTATGYWVGEMKPIPASAQDFSDVTLKPLKVGALAVVSNELLRDSSPAAEMLVRDALVDASGQRVDTTFLSTSAAVAGVSPAGMLQGLSAGVSAGNDGTGVRDDVKALYSGFITAKNANGLYFVMNPALAKAIQLIMNTLGLAEFPDITQEGGKLLGDPVVTGDNVAADDLILLKPSDIYKIGDSGVEVSISREAMIEMSSAPTGEGVTPTAASQAMVSMFQAESTAIKVVRSINFAKRRSTAVAFIGDAAYGATSV